MKKIIKLTESDIRGLIKEALSSMEEEDNVVNEIYEFFESQDKSWDKWKEIALQLMNWLGNKQLVEWAQANDYWQPFAEDDEPTPYDGHGVYTMNNWRHDGTLGNLKPGTLVSNEVVTELANSMPPTTYSRSYFQCGEPYSHKNGVPVFMSFEAAGNGNWKYVGLKPAGE